MKSNYKEKRQAQLEAFQRLADKNADLSKSSYGQAHKLGDMIPMGQPILVGHHSERGHRNHLKKIDNAMRKSVEADKKADYYANKADNIENGTAISSDNPEAIDLLREKLAGLERNQQLMKDCNKIIKSNKLPEAEKITLLMGLGLKESTALEVMQPHYGRVGIPGFKLTNNNANIRTVKQRIEHLEKLAAIQTTEKEINGITLKVSAEDNRVQIFFPSIPSEDTRKKLKSAGFHWSPTVGAWMRQISNYAIYQAESILNSLPA
jgi:hypothetical protein